MNDLRIDSSDSIDEHEWTFLVFLLLMEEIKQKDAQWEEFERQLIYENRFSSDHAIVEEIHKKEKAATRVLATNSTLYRARCFDKSNFDRLIEYYMKESGYTREDARKTIQEWSDQDKLLVLLPQLYSDIAPNSLKSTTESRALVNAQKKWKRNVKFKGYNKKDSSAPDANLVGIGRANPDHIRYLYLCEDELTPIYEMRPIIGQTISVAKFKLKKDVKIFDLTLDMSDDYKDPDYSLPSLYNSIGKKFSKPYSGETVRYIPTQFLAEEIKRMGFDGLRFNSSLHSGGVNVVLFDPDNAEAVSSDLVDVKEIKIITDQPMIYRIGTPQK